MKFGRVGDKSCKEWRQKIGGGGGGGLKGVNKNATFLFIFNTGLPIHRTEETAFWAISSIRICKVS